jgi:hypothetical protein
MEQGISLTVVADKGAAKDFHNMTIFIFQNLTCRF